MEILRNWAFLPYYNDLSVEPIQLRVYKRRYAVIDSNALIEMMESSFDGVWITDGEGKVLFANSANASLLGVSKAELEGRTTQQLLDEKIFPILSFWRLSGKKSRFQKSATIITRG